MVTKYTWTKCIAAKRCFPRLAWRNTKHCMHWPMHRKVLVIMYTSPTKAHYFVTSGNISKLLLLFFCDWHRESFCFFSFCLCSVMPYLCWSSLSLWWLAANLALFSFYFVTCRLIIVLLRCLWLHILVLYIFLFRNLTSYPSTLNLSFS